MKKMSKSIYLFCFSVFFILNAVYCVQADTLKAANFGSGFVISQDGLVVTNFHVVDRLKNIQIFFPLSDKSFSAKILLKDSNNDIAILKIDDYNFQQFDEEIPYSINPSSDVKLGQDVYTIGFPLPGMLSSGPKFTKGNISSVFGTTDDPRHFQISVPVQEGNSGGPLFDSNGCVVGIVDSKLIDVLFHKDNTFSIPQNVNFAIKAEYLLNLIGMLPDGEKIIKKKGESKTGKTTIERQVQKAIPFIVQIISYEYYAKNKITEIKPPIEPEKEETVKKEPEPKSTSVYDKRKALEWTQKSYKCLKNKEWAEAIRTSSIAISLDPDLADAYAKRAWAYCEKGLFDEAIKDCNKALEIDPYSADALNNRGLVYHKSGEIKKAKDDYEKACKLGLELACDNYKLIIGYSPKDRVEQLIKESERCFEKKKWDEVIVLTSKILALKPENDLAYAIRAGAYANKGLNEEAVKDCNMAIKINPDLGIAYNNRGYAFERMGKRKEASLDYEISCNLGLKLGCENLEKLSAVK